MTSIDSHRRGVTDFVHIGLVVEDLDETVRFLALLGFDCGKPGVFSGGWIDQIIGLENVTVEVVMARAPNGSDVFEVVRFDSPSAGAQELAPAANRPGLRHVAFKVDDVRGVVDRVREAGWDTVGEIVDFENTFLLCYIRGPEGLIVELAERLDGEPRPTTSRARIMGDHLIVLHSAVRACAGYSRHDAPSILLDGSSMARDTEHGRAVTAQLTRRQGTLEEAIAAAVFALGAAGLSKGIRRQARAACEDYFYSRLGLTPSHELGGRGEIGESLELMPEPMYRALEDVVGLVVDGEYEELRDASGGRLRIEDLRRRVEDDCPESLVLGPREIYGVEAITKSDDPELPGWAYFLDLRTENGPARLHIEGELEESGDGFTATLDDILP